MAYAVEASASTAKPRKKAAQGETPAARRNGANKGTVKVEKESPAASPTTNQ